MISETKEEARTLEEVDGLVEVVRLSGCGKRSRRGAGEGEDPERAQVDPASTRQATESGRGKPKPDREPEGSQESGSGKPGEPLKRTAEGDRGRAGAGRELTDQPPGEAKLPVAMAKGITCIHPEHRS